MAKWIIIIVLASLILSGCEIPIPDPAVVQQIVSDPRTAVPTQTAYPTYTPAPTYTPGPTYTPVVITMVVTPTNTLTPTLSPTPLVAPTQTSTTVPFELYQINPEIIKSYLDDPENSVGQAIKFLLEPSSTIYINDQESRKHLAVFPNQKLQFEILAIEDDLSDETIDLTQTNQFSWAYGVIIGTVDYTLRKDIGLGIKPIVYQMPVVRIVHQVTIERSKWPKTDGLYEVNKDIAPGPWVSILSLTDTDKCHWERINGYGRIIQEQTGIAGIIVYIGETDAVVKFNGCGKMYYGWY